VSGPTRVYLARLAGLGVFDPNGDQVGRVRDAVARPRDHGQPPHVIGLVAQLPVRRRIFLPIGRVVSIDAEAVALGSGTISWRRFEKRPGELLVLEELLDRQVTIIDKAGETATFTGRRTLGTNAVADGTDCVAAGNLLANVDVPTAMVRTFCNHPAAHLAERLLLALAAGQVSGGEMGPVRSAGLLVVHEQPWPLVDLRVDWDEQNPVSTLHRLWDRFLPQMNNYVARALDPAKAPAYGVPGDPGLERL